ncbi:MAG TPA: hypothetical protein VJP85_00380 [Candidatus Baltobacteraceae bacterium]|nr:hypothetical protein [Candidatus Baltobacteraceae bacterium]
MVDFWVHWSKLNNELFALIYADPELRVRYDLADSHEAQEMCGELFDRLVDNPSDFMKRYTVALQ